MHPLDKHILSALIRNPQLRYAELRPPNVEGNLFMYHLKRLANDGLIRKSADGAYELTPDGKLTADKMQLDTLEIDRQPRIVILMAVREKTKGWLLHRRKVQPVIDMVGFLHANLKLGESILDTAAATLKRVTGLAASFKFRGSGSITIYKSKEVESFIAFYLVEATKTSGQLIAETELGLNFWEARPDFERPDFIPSMKQMVRLLDGPKQPFFTELTYNID